MSTRERWIVYPLLFLTLGIAMRDKVYPPAQFRADEIYCNQLQVGHVICNRLESGQSECRSLFVKGQLLQLTLPWRLEVKPPPAQLQKGPAAPGQAPNNQTTQKTPNS